MVINRFSLFILFFIGFSIFSDSNAAIPQPTLENLNASYLYPVQDSNMPPKNLTIPGLFNLISKGKMPASCTVNVPDNPLYPTWEFKKGLPEGISTPIFIHSGPRDDFMGRFWHGRDGHGIRCTHPWIKNSIISNHFVTLDYFYEPKGFDFGQGINVDCLDLIYTELCQKNPYSPLVVAATCVGAKIALEFAATRQCDHIQAMILESPFIDVKRFMKNIDKSYGSWLPFQIKSLLKWYFSNCKDALKKPYADLANIDPQLPIFIVHRHNDSFYKNQDMFELVQRLKSNGNNNIYLLVLSDNRHSHGHLNNSNEFALATNAFLAAYNLPHIPELAADGQQILDIAYANAQAKDHFDWVFYQS